MAPSASPLPDWKNTPPPTAACLIGSSTIQERIHSLADEIDRFFETQEYVLIGVLKGAIHFVSDLARALKGDPQLEWIRVRTYPTGILPNPTSEVSPVGDFTLRGCTVLVLDDVLDRGLTCQAVNLFLEAQQPAQVHWCFFLAKEGSIEKTGIQPNFIGFTVPDRWLIGYGLDLDEKYRNLPGIYYLPDAEAPVNRIQSD